MKSEISVILSDAQGMDNEVRMEGEGIVSDPSPTISGSVRVINLTMTS